VLFVRIQLPRTVKVQEVWEGKLGRDVLRLFGRLQLLLIRLLGLVLRLSEEGHDLFVNFKTTSGHTG